MASISTEGRIFFREEKTNFERIAHLNTEFDSPKEAHFKTGKTEKKEVISFQYPSESNLTAHSFPTPIISFPKVSLRSYVSTSGCAFKQTKQMKR